MVVCMFIIYFDVHIYWHTPSHTVRWTITKAEILNKLHFCGTYFTDNICKSFLKIKSSIGRNHFTAFIVPCILNLSIKHRWMVNSCPIHYVPWGKIPHYSLNRSLGGPQSHMRCFREQRNILPLPGIDAWFLSHQSCSLVTTPNIVSCFPQ